MDPEFPLRGPARRWYLVPLVAGLALMVVSVLIVAYPRLLAILFAVPMFLAGLGIFLFGLDLWHGIADWRRRMRELQRRCWPGEEE
ncbi:MAG TPA: hypothetical protein VM492_14615 [Sumerlaeia bacterium]|nr:hypothetical protein [Sumerlaeia bacterium]